MLNRADDAVGPRCCDRPMFRQAYGLGAISERRPYTPSLYPPIRPRIPALRDFYAGICSRSRLFEISSGQRGKKSSKAIVTLQEVSLGVFQQFFFKAAACRMNRHRARRKDRHADEST